MCTQIHANKLVRNRPTPKQMFLDIPSTRGKIPKQGIEYILSANSPNKLVALIAPYTPHKSKNAQPRPTTLNATPPHAFNKTPLSRFTGYGDVRREKKCFMCLPISVITERGKKGGKGGRRSLKGGTLRFLWRTVILELWRDAPGVVAVGTREGPGGGD